MVYCFSVNKPVTKDNGLFNGLLSAECLKAIFPARASRSSSILPVKHIPKASMYRSLRLAVIA